jgi:hypothetical protein
MRRIFGFMCLAAILVALPLTHSLAGKSEKVTICHLDSANSPGVHQFSWNWLGPFYPRAKYTMYYGRVIEVAEDAVDAHLAHGDRVEDFYTPDDTSPYGHYWSDWDEFVYFGESLTTIYPDQRQWPHWFDDTDAVVKNANCGWVTYELIEE